MTLIKVKVLSTEIEKREGVSPKTNKPYTIRSQDVICEFDGEVRKVPINLAENVGAYQVGNYTIDPYELIQIGRYGFEFARFKEIKLTPVQVAAVPRTGTA